MSNRLLNRRRSRRVCVVVACAAFAPLAHANTITGTHGWQIIQRLTGPGITSNVGIGGTDLGHMVNHNGKTYFFFGDTFANDAANGAGTTDWRNNVMAYTSDKNAADGIQLDGWLTRSNGTAKQMIVPGSSPTTYIPTGAISVNNKIYAWYMHVSNWSTGWTLDHAGLASWQEGQSQFSIVPNYKFQTPGSAIYTTDDGRGNRGNFGMVAASQRSSLENTSDDNVYIWGTPGGRLGGVKLARVAPGTIENLSTYQYFNGTVNGVPQWTNNEFDGDRVIESGVGEMSVMYNPAVEAWTMMYFNGANNRMEIRSSKTPWGDWSSPTTVVLPEQAPGLYAPYMNPLYTENNGKTLYFTMSLWDPYDVYLAKVDLDLDLSTSWTGAIGNWTAASWDYGSPTTMDKTFIDNGGSVQVNSPISVKNFDIGSAAGKSGELFMFVNGGLTLSEGGFRLGQAQGGSGKLTMNGGAINVTGGYNMFIVGDNGSGDATINGGTVSAKTFVVGVQPTSTGKLTLGGTAVINTTGDRFVLGFNRNIATGARATATMTMTGGTVNVNAGSSGLPDAVIGFDGAATFDMSGGAFNVSGLFVSAVSGALGNTPRAQATIKQTGGTINAGTVVISENGVSQYDLSGSGSIQSRGRMTLGWRANSSATFNQTGGSIAVGENLIVGDLGSATLTQSGGAISVTNQLRVGAKGVVNLNGGSLQASALHVDAGGKVNFGLGATQRLTVDSLSVAGTLDLGDDALVVRNGGATKLADVNALIKSGHANGTWTGAGITSAATLANASMGIGSTLASSLNVVPAVFGTAGDDDVLVRVTFRGDADLSGNVNFDDLVILAQYYNLPTGATWSTGDSTYDGTVNFDDLVPLAQNYNKALPATVISEFPAAFVTDWAMARALVPEPTTLSLVAFGALLRRRRTV